MRIAPRHIGRLSLPLLALPLCAALLSAQGRAGRRATPSEAATTSSDPVIENFHFRSIGPASMGGRIDDIAVSESNPSVIYIGYAVGGLFRSTNNATTFVPVFTKYSTASIGDIAIHPTNPDIVYVGTGEPNNRQTSSFGDGIYKTTDGGKTFTNIGLRETQSIARIVIDPRNPEIVYVAVPGHLFGPNPDRGVYKTTDGGGSWNKIKYIDENTGFNDLVMDPSNSSVLYASSYQRRRSGCCMNGGGPGSALWKTEDGGRSWTKVQGNGLPKGTYGRIALDISRSNPNVVYAQIEAGETGTTGVAAAAAAAASAAASSEATPPGAAAVVGGRGARGGRGAAAAPAAADVTAAGPAAAGGGGGRGGFDWCNNGAPVPAGRAGAPAPATPPALDAEKGGVFRSENRGRSWTLMSNCNSRPMYFSQLRVDPGNDKTIYVAGLPVAKSLDGGKTFATLDGAGGYGDPAHVDQHAIWVDPKNGQHIMEGNDGGLDISWDQGKTWDFVNTMATGLAYWVSADMRRPYYLYTGLQDNGSWGGPSGTRGGSGVMNNDWFGIGGGDGFQTAVDPTDPNTVYTESQDGSTSRYDLRTGQQKSIRPAAGGAAGRGAGTGGCVDGRVGGGGGGGGGGGRGGNASNVVNAQPGDQYRFNWNTPYMLSPHNPSIVWYGGNRLFKSYNRGDTYVASVDLTKQVDRCKISLMGAPADKSQLSKNDGVVSYSTIISISESPVMPGVVWAGTDDGNVQVSRDGAVNFTEVGRNIAGLPANALSGDNPYWISRIDASHFDQGTAYVAVDGHRSDDLHPYVFVTHDFGKTFSSVTADLPPYGNVQVIREDPKNKDLLYVGTEFGLYVSIDAGKSWKHFAGGYPTVRTDDILIHPRDNDLIVATHGRSLWIADDITPLQQFTPAVAASDANLFDVRPAIQWTNDRTAGQHIGGQKVFIGENAPRGTTISYYLKTAAAGDVKISISDGSGRMLCNGDAPKGAGINRVRWSLNAPLIAGAGAGAGAGGGGGGGGRGAAGPVDPTCAAPAEAGRGGGGGGRGGAAGITPGTYTVKLSVGGKDYTKTVQVLEDRWFNER